MNEETEKIPIENEDKKEWNGVKGKEVIEEVNKGERIEEAKVEIVENEGMEVKEEERTVEVQKEGVKESDRGLGGVKEDMGIGNRSENEVKEVVEKSENKHEVDNVLNEVNHNDREVHSPSNNQNIINTENQAKKKPKVKPLKEYNPFLSSNQEASEKEKDFYK